MRDTLFVSVPFAKLKPPKNREQLPGPPPFPCVGMAWQGLDRSLAPRSSVRAACCIQGTCIQIRSLVLSRWYPRPARRALPGSRSIPARLTTRVAREGERRGEGPTAYRPHVRSAVQRVVARRGAVRPGRHPVCRRGLAWQGAAWRGVAGRAVRET